MSFSFSEIVLEKGKKISAIFNIKRNTLLIIRLIRKHIKLQSKNVIDCTNIILNNRIATILFKILKNLI